MARRKTENYVNNRDFLDALMVYRKEVAEAEANEQDRKSVV